MQASYPDWLSRAVPTQRTASTKLSELRRIESVYGDLDDHFDRDELQSIIDELTYTSSDAKDGRPNPSRLAIDGDIRTNLASYKSAVQKYARFRQDIELEAARPGGPAPIDLMIANELESERTFSLEKDLEAALRAHIALLEPGLSVADGGTQRTVPSGRIDILALGAQGQTVVIELKAVRAPRDAVAQVLAYMGDIQETAAQPVRGILVAPEFDPRAIAAARMVPNLTLVTYAFTFSFTRHAQ